jgi:hypothetical protein
MVNNIMLDLLQKIPHLDLGLTYNPITMLEEVKNFNYANYQTSYATAKELYEKNWSGASLISIDGSVFGDMSELKIYPKISPKETALASQCPYLMSILHDIGSSKERSRIMRIAPKGTLDWHSHVLHHKQDPKRLVVQIPIIVPKGFTYSVMHAKDLSSLKKGKPVKTYDKEYKEGKTYVFNSFHPHNVFNPSNEYRITLMTYMNIDNPKSKKILEKAVENYDGPLL